MSIVPAGTTNLAAAGVPNVLVQIVPPNPLLNGVPTNIVGVVGTATWGPINSPTTIGSLAELISDFGNPQNALYDLGTPVYNAMQQGANDFLCIRVTDGTDVNAHQNILDNASVSGVTLTALYSGTQGNQINAVLSVGSSNTVVIGANPTNYNSYKLTIYMNGGVAEVFDNIPCPVSAPFASFWTALANAVNLGQSNLRGPSQLVTATTATNIQSVTVTAAGSYATMPTLGTSGSGSAATLAPDMKAVSATVTTPGTGYIPADTITLTGGVHSTSAILTVDTVQLDSVVLNAAGTGYNVNDLIVLAGGTFSTAAILKVTAIGVAGAVSTFTVQSGGSYTVETATFTQGSTSGTGSGATFNTAVWGVNTAHVSTAGSFTTLPANPVLQGSTSGVGTGAQFTVLWGLLSVIVSAGGSGYTASSGFTVTGGGGTGGATGQLVLGSASYPNLPNGTSTLPTQTLTLANGTNGNAGVTDATLIGFDVPTVINGVTYNRTGMYALRNTAASICMLSDQTNSSYWATQVTFGLNEGMYMIAAMANSYSSNIAGAVALKSAAGVNSYAMKLMLGDWCLMNDPFNNVQRFASPQGFVCGILATLDPSGSSLNKQMTGVIATQKTANQQIYSEADLLQLVGGGIDVITSPIPLSPSSTIFGCRIGCNTSSDITVNGDNYTRMINFLAETFNSGLGAFIGLPQTADVQRQAKNMLQSFLQNLVQAGTIGALYGAPAFKVTLDSTNNPPNRIALGFMQADVQVTLWSIIQKFVINLQAGQSVQIQVLPAQLAA